METLFPISKTKIIPPRRRVEIITRPRLIETIHSLLNKKLTLISAPAGYGKTSLLIDLADKSEIPVCWLSLDIMDQEPQRFLSYFIACIQEKFPAFGAESLTVLRNAASVEKENERLAVTFSNEIYQEIHEYFAIVLDDYQFIDPIPEIRIFINRFIQLAGENCHVILASRILPTLPDLHLLVARDQIGGMSLEDLAFLPEEIQTLFAQNSSQFLSIDEARELASKTDGWITSIALTGLSFTASGHVRRNPASRTGIELNDYFSIEVLDKQTPDVQEFLLLTSLFDDVSVDLCSAVLDPLVGDQRIAWDVLFNLVQINNLFAIPVGNEGLYFRYHHLFQEFLQNKLQQEHPGIIKKVMTGLAMLYRERHEWEKAHHIYENLADISAQVTLIEEAGTYFIRNGRIVTLGNWLEQLPISVLQHNARLLSLQGTVASTQGDTQLGISLLSQAEGKFRTDNDNENLAYALVRRASIYREMADYNRALADADEVIALTTKKENHFPLEVLAAAQRVKGQVLFRLGKSPDALKHLQDSLRLFTALADKPHIPILEMEMGAIQYSIGNDEIAIKLYRSALQAWEATGNLGWQATLMNNLGVLHHYRGEYEKAFEMLEGAIEAAQRSGFVRAQALALSSLGDLLADVRETERSQECFDQALIIASQHGYSFLVFYSSVAKARAARLGNHFALAESMLRDLFVHIQQNTSPTEEALFRMEFGCILLHTHKLNEGMGELERAVNLYEQDGRVLEACIGKLWLAAAMIAAGGSDPGTGRINELVSAYKGLKEPASLYAAAAEVQRWLKINNARQVLLTPLQGLFKKADDFSKRIPAVRRRLRRISKSALLSAPQLTIQAFGAVQVTLNEKKITITDWQTRETRDLFFFFLGSPPVTKEEVAAIFWPDLSPARLKMRFKTSLYRLRHAVGQNVILFEAERYRFNPDLDYEYDLETFNELVEQADLAKTKIEKSAHLQTAVDLVGGTYLADVDWEWAEQERNHTEMKYHSILLQLAELYVDTGQAAKAIAVCQIALGTDHLLEEAYRINMRACALVGDMAAVARVYRTCQETLFNELGIKPSKETETLYKQLV